jgi:hypothetical protein
METTAAVTKIGSRSYYPIGITTEVSGRYILATVQHFSRAYTQFSSLRGPPICRSINDSQPSPTRAKLAENLALGAKVGGAKPGLRMPKSPAGQSSARG